MAIVNSFVADIFDKIAVEAGALARVNKQKTLSSRAIQTAVRLVLPASLAKHFIPRVDQGGQEMRRCHLGECVCVCDVLL
jgi:hypothetical protein